MEKSIVSTGIKWSWNTRGRVCGTHSPIQPKSLHGSSIDTGYAASHARLMAAGGLLRIRDISSLTQDKLQHCNGSLHQWFCWHKSALIHDGRSDLERASRFSSLAGTNLRTERRQSGIQKGAKDLVHTITASSTSFCPLPCRSRGLPALAVLGDLLVSRGCCCKSCVFNRQPFYDSGTLSHDSPILDRFLSRIKWFLWQQFFNKVAYCSK